MVQFFHQKVERVQMIQLKIGQIRAGMRNMKIIGTLKEVTRPVEMGTRYGPALLARAVLEDETGSVRLNLWRDQIDVAKAGDTVLLENAFAREFGGVVEVNIGADGRISLTKPT
jgi:ssDNA-binding replication factor A large subunit